MVGAGAGQWPNAAVVGAGAGGTPNTGLIENPDGGLRTNWQLLRDPMARGAHSQPRAAPNCSAYLCPGWRSEPGTAVRVVATGHHVHLLGQIFRCGLYRDRVEYIHCLGDAGSDS